MEEVVIIGGGVAGLCAANALLDAGFSPLLLEAQSFNTQRVCGEFISSEAIEILEKWGITPSQNISRIHLYSRESAFHLPLPEPCGSMMRSYIESLLVRRAQERGARLKENTRITGIIPPSDPAQSLRGGFQLEISSGRRIEASSIVVASGRVFAPTSPVPPYLTGFSAHFSGVDCEDSILHMHSLPGAYIGVSPVGNGMVNCACLALSRDVEERGSIQAYFEGLLEQSSSLRSHFHVGSTIPQEDWRMAKIPGFGMKTPPLWPHCYLVGDALATIPPASGDGLAISITSAVQAAQYILKNDSIGYLRSWKKEYQARLRWAKVLHTILIRPSYASFAISLCQYLPQAARFLYDRTRS